MSLLAVQGGATGTGTVTLLAPVTNTNRTLTLPDETGTLATLASIPANAYIGGRGQVFTTVGSGTPFTVPTGVTAVKVTVIGGGGNGGTVTGTGSAGGGGGGGGVSIEFVTGLTPGDAVTVTVGGAAGTSSFGAFCSATGGATAATVTAGATNGAGGAGGAGSGGDINISGGAGGSGNVTTNEGGPGGGSSGDKGIPRSNFYFCANYTGSSPQIPGVGFLGGVGAEGNGNATGLAATGFGNGGGGAYAGSATDRTGGAGSSGIVIVEF